LNQAMAALLGETTQNILTSEATYGELSFDEHIVNVDLFIEEQWRVAVYFRQRAPDIGIVEQDLNYVIDPKTGKEVPDGFAPAPNGFVPWLKTINSAPNLPLVLIDQHNAELWRFPPVSEPRVWTELSLSQLGKANASFSTEWKDGRLYYQFSVTPTPVLNAARQRSTRQVGATTLLRPPELGIQLFDKDTFKLIEISLPIPDLLGEVDEHGKEQRFSARDSIECSLEKYQSIRSWSLAWRL
jgi:hypothetical protein